MRTEARLAGRVERWVAMSEAKRLARMPDRGRENAACAVPMAIIVNETQSACGAVSNSAADRLSIPAGLVAEALIIAGRPDAGEGGSAE